MLLVKNNKNHEDKNRTTSTLKTIKSLTKKTEEEAEAQLEEEQINIVIEMMQEVLVKHLVRIFEVKFACTCSRTLAL